MPRAQDAVSSSAGLRPWAARLPTSLWLRLTATPSARRCVAPLARVSTWAKSSSFNGRSPANARGVASDLLDH